MAKGKKKSDITYKIIKIHYFLDQDCKKVYVRVAWGDMPPRDEVRTCWKKDGKLYLGKGIPLTEEEIRNLYDFCETVGVDFDPDSYKDDNEPGVDFDDIFRQSEGIMDKRNAGYRTKDGFIVLSRKDGKRK